MEIVSMSRTGLLPARYAPMTVSADPNKDIRALLASILQQLARIALQIDGIAAGAFGKRSATTEESLQMDGLVIRGVAGWRKWPAVKAISMTAGINKRRQNAR
jgi:hypothetical protein